MPRNSSTTPTTSPPLTSPPRKRWGSARSPLSTLLFVLLLSPIALAAPRFAVTIAPDLNPASDKGRVIVYLIAEDAGISTRAQPANGPFFSNPQPMYATNATAFKPGAAVYLDHNATAFPTPLDQLPAGDYRAQAVFDCVAANSSWQREPGNLVSETITFTLPPQGSPERANLTIPITLSRAVQDRTPPRLPAGVTLVEIPSPLLTAFHGVPTTLRAGVVAPLNQKPDTQYAAIYNIPGFGGDHMSALREGRSRLSDRLAGDAKALAESTFAIVLDPESANGHHLFANSDNNGPVADALIQELIPALEAQFPLIPHKDARILRGHSSGGWSTLWLGLTEPETFGRVFSSAPDPVDFTEFQNINIYNDPSAYTDAAGDRRASYTSDGKVLMTIEQENLMEEVMGPGNTSGQQWDSWFAVFGPRDDKGNPASLWNPQSGEIDQKVAESYRKYDIADRVRDEPTLYAPLLRARVTLIVGNADSFDLHRAVIKLRDALDTAQPGAPSDAGSIEIVPGADHGSVLGSPQARAFPSKMLAWLTEKGMLPR